MIILKTRTQDLCHKFNPKIERTPIVILILSRFDQNIPVATKTIGGREYYGGENFDFTVWDSTEVRHACTVTWKDRHFVFGGYQHPTQVAEVIHHERGPACGMSRSFALSFPHSKDFKR